MDLALFIVGVRILSFIDSPFDPSLSSKILQTLVYALVVAEASFRVRRQKSFGIGRPV